MGTPCSVRLLSRVGMLRSLGSLGCCCLPGAPQTAPGNLLNWPILLCYQLSLAPNDDRGYFILNKISNFHSHVCLCCSVSQSCSGRLRKAPHIYFFSGFHTACGCWVKNNVAPLLELPPKQQIQAEGCAGETANGAAAPTAHRVNSFNLVMVQAGCENPPRERGRAAVLWCCEFYVFPCFQCLKNKATTLLG